MSGEMEPILSAVHCLVDEYRDRCLWFLRRDFYPVNPEQILRVLGHIQRHGDQAAYRRAARIRGCLSQSSSGLSAGS